MLRNERCSLVSMLWWIWVFSQRQQMRVYKCRMRKATQMECEQSSLSTGINHQYGIRPGQMSSSSALCQGCSGLCSRLWCACGEPGFVYESILFQAPTCIRLGFHNVGSILILQVFAVGYSACLPLPVESQLLEMGLILSFLKAPQLTFWCLELSTA